jgi:hypothetical protein
MTAEVRIDLRQGGSYHDEASWASSELPVDEFLTCLSFHPAGSRLWRGRGSEACEEEEEWIAYKSSEHFNPGLALM